MWEEFHHYKTHTHDSITVPTSECVEPDPPYPGSWIRAEPGSVVTRTKHALYYGQFLPSPILRQFTLHACNQFFELGVLSTFAMLTACCRAKALRQVKVRPANNWEKYSSRVEFFCPMQTDMALFGFHSKMLAHDSREENLTNMEYKIKSIWKKIMDECNFSRRI